MNLIYKKNEISKAVAGTCKEYVSAEYNTYELNDLYNTVVKGL